eukprot:scaffold1509_cov240-Pinguiococcus_pyrenoidosus.AAC.6
MGIGVVSSQRQERRQAAVDHRLRLGHHGVGHVAQADGAVASGVGVVVAAHQHRRLQPSAARHEASRAHVGAQVAHGHDGVALRFQVAALAQRHQGGAHARLGQRHLVGSGAAQVVQRQRGGALHLGSGAVGEMKQRRRGAGVHQRHAIHAMGRQVANGHGGVAPQLFGAVSRAELKQRRDETSALHLQLVQWVCCEVARGHEGILEAPAAAPARRSPPPERDCPHVRRCCKAPYQRRHAPQRRGYPAAPAAPVGRPRPRSSSGCPWRRPGGTAAARRSGGSCRSATPAKYSGVSARPTAPAAAADASSPPSYPAPLRPLLRRRRHFGDRDVTPDSPSIWRTRREYPQHRAAPERLGRRRRRPSPAAAGCPRAPPSWPACRPAAAPGRRRRWRTAPGEAAGRPAAREAA